MLFRSRLTREEYAARRRAVLPFGAVVQEKENLDFLVTQYDLYEAENTLFAARIENGILYATELLGDDGLAPRLVSALNCKEGCFRLQGKGDTLAMYYPVFQKEEQPPTYFGLAFD